MQVNRRSLMLGTGAALAGLRPARARQRSAPGVTDTEIVIGSTMPFSGPLSILGTLGKTSQAYFRKLNAAGGIHGRQIRLIQYDDGYNPGKALELTRRLVEQDQVSFVFETVGTSTNNAIYRYLNGRKIPHLLIFSGASKWSDAAAIPFTLPGMASYRAEGRVYARWIREHMPQARIAILMQNDDFGRDYLSGIRDGLGERADGMIVAQSSYETTDASVDSQVVSLKASGASVFISLSNGKFTVQSLRKAHDIGWKPQIILPLGSASLSAIMRPAGAQAGLGAITALSNKPAAGAMFEKDPGVQGLQAFVQQWLPGADPTDSLVSAGYTMAQILEHILRQCGDDLSREQIMRQANSLNGITPPLLMPGISLGTSATDHELFSHLWLQRFDGRTWLPFGQAVPV